MLGASAGSYPQIFGRLLDIWAEALRLSFMRNPSPLPRSLERGAFSLRDLREAGISTQRVRRRDIVPIGSGVYATASRIATANEDMIYRMKAQALLREYPHAWLSHTTAAKLLAAPLPRRLDEDATIHLSVRQPEPRPRRRGVIGHEALPVHQWFSLPGSREMRMTAPGWLMLELASRCSLEELVCIGDWLVRQPRYWADGRDLAYATLHQLRTAAESAATFPGVKNVRRAVQLIRVGADSPKETQFRLALLRAGLPEPQLQYPLNDLQPGARPADAAYPDYRVAIQYDGASHFSPDQARADQRRDNQAIAAGWAVLRFNVTDDREGFVTAIDHVRSVLHAQGWWP